MDIKTRFEHYSRTVENAALVSGFFIKYFDFKVTVDRKGIDTPYFREIIGMPDSVVNMLFLENAEGFMIELFEFVLPGGVKQDPATNNPGSTHICFIVDDIFGMVSKMRADGVKTRTPEPVYVDKGQHTGSYAIYVYNPENTVVELIQLPVE